MGRIIAIDYGRKRVGLAVTDALKLFATPLGTVPTHELTGYLKKYLGENDVECVVVGEPRDMKNRASESETYIIPFLKILRSGFPDLCIERVDERFTSKMAASAIREAGLKKKDRRNKALVDSVSATIILQSYLDTITLSSKT